MGRTRHYNPFLSKPILRTGTVKSSQKSQKFNYFKLERKIDPPPSCESKPPFSTTTPPVLKLALCPTLILMYQNIFISMSNDVALIGIGPSPQSYSLRSLPPLLSSLPSLRREALVSLSPASIARLLSRVFCTQVSGCTCNYER